MVHNTGKSTVGGIGEGGLMPGDRPASEYDRYLSWIKNGKMKSASKWHSSPTKGYVIEWMISFDLLAIRPGLTYNSKMGDTAMGLNIALGDVDTPKDGHPFYGIRHEQWFSGEKTNRTQINEFGTLWLMHSKR